MSHRRSKLVAGAVAAAVMLTGCGPQVVAGRPTVTPLQKMLYGMEQTKAAEAAQFRTRNVTGLGNRTYTSTAKSGQYGPSPAPGLMLTLEKPLGISHCTLGAVLVADNPLAQFPTPILTAGHCGDLGTPTSLQVGPALKDLRPLSAITTSRFDGLEPIDNLKFDYAVAFSDVIPDNAAVRIAGRWPVGGVLTEEAVRQLPSKTQICLLGTYSGVQCGGKLGGTRSALMFDAGSQHGDSGGLVFIVDADRDVALLVGIVSGMPEGGLHTYAVLLDTMLQQTGRKALVDASVMIENDDRLSKSVHGI